jgi:hypothetical protein
MLAFQRRDLLSEAHGAMPKLPFVVPFDRL